MSLSKPIDPAAEKLKDDVIVSERSQHPVPTAGMQPSCAADVTIISNNCWGAAFYRDTGIPYRTPFVGLFLMPGCYLRLLADLHCNIHAPLEFKKQSFYPEINADRDISQRRYPIGCLDGKIEIHFVHYGNEIEAKDKWQRRVARMVTEDRRLFVKFCDHDRPTMTQLQMFDRLPFRNKACFLATPSPKLKCGVWLPSYEEEGRVPDGWQLYGICQGRFDVTRWLKGGKGPKSMADRVRNRLILGLHKT